MLAAATPATIPVEVKMPGGKCKPPYKAANPVEPGWNVEAWYHAYNCVNSRIRKAGGPGTEVAARESGRTREEAKLLKDTYSQTTGRYIRSTGSLPDSLLPNSEGARANFESALASSEFHPATVVEKDSDYHHQGLTMATNTMLSVPTLSYPLTASQAEQVNLIYQEESTKINDSLESVRALCAEKCKSSTKQCVEHSKEIRSLWRKYYTTIRSGSWVSYRSPEYVAEMRKLFDNKTDIQKIHARATKETRLHQKDATCTVRFNDCPAVKKYKLEAAAMFDGDTPELEIREFMHKKELQVKEERSPKELEYDARLAACKNEEEKRVIYEEDACTPSAGDTQAMLKLRIKWRGLFNSGMPHLDIYAMVQKDIVDYTKLERDLREKLAELQRAKAAHDKAEIAKEAKKAAKELTARIRTLSKFTFYCSTEHCQNLSVPISEEKGNLECGICKQLSRTGIPQDRSFFCSEECMERDGRTHVLKAHCCAAAAACTTGVFHRSIHENYTGTCSDCWKFFGVVSYFCTHECWVKNWPDHLTRRHSQLRVELVEKLENNKDFFDEWSVRMNLTEDEIRRATTGLA